MHRSREIYRVLTVPCGKNFCRIGGYALRAVCQHGLAQRIRRLNVGFKAGSACRKVAARGVARKIAGLMHDLAKKGIDIKDLAFRANSPIRFILPRGGVVADGYEATILPDVCAVIIEAGRLGKLGKRLSHLAERCAVLQHGFATLGIIALVDEATGYQDYRTRDALAKILERFVAKEIQPYVRTFPAEFYKQILSFEWMGLRRKLRQAKRSWSLDQ